MNRPVHFEIHAEDPERAVRFYQRIFGWEMQKWEGPMEYWTVRTGPDDRPGINGGLLRRRGPSPGEAAPVVGYVCTVQVKSVDDAVRTITESGGVIAVPKMAIPGVGWLAYFKDTEGNVVGVMEDDPKAA